MHIEILKHPSKGFEVRVVDAAGDDSNVHLSTIESARKAARDWTAAYGNCPMNDKSWPKE
jgi:hypothetical protein